MSEKRGTGRFCSHTMTVIISEDYFTSSWTKLIWKYSGTVQCKCTEAQNKLKLMANRSPRRVLVA